MTKPIAIAAVIVAALAMLSFLGLHGYTWIRFHQLKTRAYTHYKTTLGSPTTITEDPRTFAPSDAARMDIHWEDLVISLPDGGSLVTTGIRHSLQYPGFEVTLAVNKPESEALLDDLPDAWGRSEFEKYQTVFETPVERIQFASSASELDYLVAVMQVKSVLMHVSSLDRCVQFRTESLRGYISGSATASKNVVIDSFLTQDLDRYCGISFRPKAECTDKDIERFLGDISIRMDTDKMQ